MGVRRNFGAILLFGVACGGGGGKSAESAATTSTTDDAPAPGTTDSPGPLPETGDTEVPVETGETGDTAAPSPVPFGLRRVLVAAGPLSDCWRYTIGGCDLQDISVDVDAGTIVDNGSLADTSGAVAPSFSPDGRRITVDMEDGRGHLYVTVIDLDNRARVRLGMGNKSAWIDADTVVYGASNETVRTDESSRWSDIVMQDVPDTAGLSGTSVATTDIVRVLGAENAATGFESDDCTGEDPTPVPGRPGWLATHSVPWRFTSRPSDGSFEAHTCPWLVGLNPYTDAKDPRAVVFDSSATAWSEGVSWEPVDAAGAGITGCAHISVSPSGTRLVCTNQPGVTTVVDSVDGAVAERNDLYGFDRVGTTWVPARGTAPVFDHPDPRDLPDAADLWQAGRSCHVVRTKQANFCGDDHLLAADVYCEDTSVDPAHPFAVFARAMLIDIRDPTAPRFVDLTSGIEDARGLPRGTLGAYTLACAPVEAD